MPAIINNSHLSQCLEYSDEKYWVSLLMILSTVILIPPNLRLIANPFAFNSLAKAAGRCAYQARFSHLVFLRNKIQLPIQITNLPGPSRPCILRTSAHLWQKAGFEKGLLTTSPYSKLIFNTINNARQIKKSYKIKFVCPQKKLLKPSNKSDNYNINYIWTRAWRAVFILSLPALRRLFRIALKRKGICMSAFTEGRSYYVRKA